MTIAELEAKLMVMQCGVEPGPIYVCILTIVFFLECTPGTSLETLTWDYMGIVTRGDILGLRWKL